MPVDGNPPIVCVSNAGWQYGLPTNRQQLPKWLARHTQVLYVSPFSLSQALMRKVRVSDYFPGAREVIPNLLLCHNIQLLPMTRGRIWPFVKLDQWLTVRFIRHQMRRLGIEQPILWLYYPPSFQFLIGQLGEVLTCYHCTDDHAGYAEALGLKSDRFMRAEERLVEAADVVFATSRPLYERHVRRNPNTFLMPNVADVERFTPVARGEITPAADVASLPRPIVGFIGAVDAYKVDLDLVADVASRLPAWSFVFVGPVGIGDGTRASDLPQADNIHYLGRRAYAELPAYLAGFDVCTIPYRRNRYTDGVFPLKFWEYLAAGKPVVTTPLPGLADDMDCAYVAGDADHFAAALTEAAATAADSTAIRRRVERASRNSWEARAGQMVQVLAAQLDRRRAHSAATPAEPAAELVGHSAPGTISVVVPTFNRAEMLCKVLPSYLASPAVREVIVVDDAGHDDTATRLQDWLRTEPRLRYLRNERNLGAPTTRNRGFAATSGDWVLQGEDDLALLPGTVDTLMAHALVSSADVIAGRRVWMRLGETPEAALARASLNRRPPFNQRLMDFNSHANAAHDMALPLLDATMLIRRTVFEQVQYHAPYAGQSTWREESDFQISALELGYKLVFCPHATAIHYSRASQSFGRNRIKGTIEYAYRMYRNNLEFLRRHRGFLADRYPRALFLGRPELSAMAYGIYRFGWLIATEVVRWQRMRTFSVPEWQ